MKLRTLIIACLLLPIGVVSCSKKDKKEDQAAVEPVTEESVNQTEDQKPQVQPTQPQVTPAPQVASMKYPLVFHHGFMGTEPGQELMDSMTVVAKNAGAQSLHFTSVSPANSIEYRANELATQIDQILQETGADKVNILAHSFGGLDSRYMISSLGYGDRVATLSTLATPHRGTPVADIVIDLSPSNLAAWVDSLFGFAGQFISAAAEEGSTIDTMAAVEDLSEDYMINVFNPANPDATDVYYQSWAGVSGYGTGHSIKPVLLTTWATMAVSGKNDGVVPEASASWGDYRGELKADHIDLSAREIGFLGGDGFNFNNFFKIYITELAEKNY